MSRIRDIEVLVNEGFGGVGGDDDQITAVTSVNGMIGDVEITKDVVGLGNVDNTADLNKPVSEQTQAQLNQKANQVDLLALGEKITGTTDELYVLKDDLSAYKEEVEADFNTKLDKTANAVSATKLQTKRNINNVPFDGTKDITVTADPNPHNHIVMMPKGSTIPVEERTEDKIYMKEIERSNINNGTASVSNMYLR